MLDLVELRKTYGDTVALDGLTLSVAPGQMLGFVGQNGAGKTTAMRITLGVLEADSGDVRWQGRDADRAVRRTFGYMPEERGLYPKMRVVEQLVYLARLHGIDRAGAQRRTEHWIDVLGLHERAHDRVESLSLGNQQRVQLAAALVHDPVALVLDEPFSGLDPVGVDALAEALQERARSGVPVIFSSHQLDLVERLCDSVAIIRAGRLVASGSVEDLRSKDRPRRLLVLVTAPGGVTVRGWASGLDGVTVLEDTDGGTVLELDPDADDQHVLDRARSLGAVRTFTPVRPSLTELFREVVAA